MGLLLDTYKLPFNPKPATLMHLDLNSCFASIEQQANSFLRGRPIAVAAYLGPGGCIVAPSVEAKKFGVKVGMRVKEGKSVCPDLLILPPDPAKYRYVHLKLKNLLLRYTDQVVPKSIDEFVLNLEGCPSFKRGLTTVANEIKLKIKAEIGEFLTVSVGIAPNRYLAKIAAGLHKPDGLDELTNDTFRMVYQTLKLTDLCGIKANTAVRLNAFGIYSVWDFYTADAMTLKCALHSITGHYWHLRLRGWEVDDVLIGRKSFGNSFALPQGLTTLATFAPILRKLVEKAAYRMRRAGYKARGVYVSVLYKDKTHWHLAKTGRDYLYATSDIYKAAYKAFETCPYTLPVHILAVACFELAPSTFCQNHLFDDTKKKYSLTYALDKINEKWGEFAITPARMLGVEKYVADRISFGGIKELEDSVLTT